MSAAEPFFHHSIRFNDYLCTLCGACVRACPTSALRIRNGKVVLYGNKCVDCGECLRTCNTRAVYIKQDDFQLLENYRHRVALVPAVFISQFEDKYKTKEIYACLYKLGFTHIYEVEQSIELLAPLYREYMDAHPEIHTFISPYCPAVIRLIQVRFPSLVDNIIKLKSPLDIAALSIRRKFENDGVRRESLGIFYVTPCAAKIASIKSPVGHYDTYINGVINMDFLYNKVKLLLSNGGKEGSSTINHSLSGRDVRWPLTGGESANFSASIFAVDGLGNVLDFLENLEDEAIDAPGLVEMRICDQSCVGGPLATSNRFVARDRMERRARLLDRLERLHKTGQEPTEDGVRASRDEFPEDLLPQVVVPEIKPRSLFKLDDNFSTAFKKAEEMKRIEKALPGINCSACGAPTCAAFAEDVVRGTANAEDCLFSEIKDTAVPVLKRIWGPSLPKSGKKRD